MLRLFALAGFVLAAPFALAEDLVNASLTSDALAPLDIPEGQQHQDVDSGKTLPSQVHVVVTASEGNKGLNAVNVKLA